MIRVLAHEEAPWFVAGQPVYHSLCNTWWFDVTGAGREACEGTWRYNGGLVSGMVNDGDYLDFYCSGQEGNLDEAYAEYMAQCGWGCVQQDGGFCLPWDEEETKATLLQWLEGNPVEKKYFTSFYRLYPWSGVSVQSAPQDIIAPSVQQEETVVPAG